MPEPFLHRFAVAGERLQVGGLAEYRRDPADRRRWLVFHHSQPGGDHQNLFVAAKKDELFVEAGDEVLVVQFFGEVLTQTILRKGEKVSGGVYERGRMRAGTPLVSAGDGTGALVSASRFLNAARFCGTAVETLDASESESDVVITIRTNSYTGSVAEAG